MTCGARLTTLVPLALIAACAGAGAGVGDPASPRGRGMLAREDRVVVTDFNDVARVAVSQRMVFVASPGGLAIYDRTFSSWFPPLSAGDGFPAERISVMVADPTTDGVWIGTAGAVLFYQPLTDVLARTLVGGFVDDIVFDRRDPAAGAWVHSGGAWTRVSASGFAQSGVTPPPPAAIVRAPTLADIYRQFPSLQTFQTLLTRDAQMRSWPVTSGARAPDRTEVWLGTLGDGVFQVDPQFNTARHHPFGLLGAGAGALSQAADGVWSIGLGTDRRGRGGLTFTSTTLQEFRWVDGPLSSPLSGARGLDLDVRASSAWAATERGLVRVNLRDERDTQVWTMLDGLPSDVALTVLARERGAWVGTSRGLAFVNDSVLARGAPRKGRVIQTAVMNTAVRALLATGDTLWIGTDAGLLLLPPGEPARPVRPAAVASEPRLLRPIRALARSDSLVVVATDDAVLRFALPSGRLLARLTTLPFGAIGAMGALAVDDQTIWAGGSLGAVVIGRETGLARVVPVAPGQLPGGVQDIVLTRDFAWLATRGGLVRLRRLPDGTVR